jgi:hypothetical protein
MGKAASLDPIHWDYRSIGAGDFQVAALYEYARCCPWVVGYWEKWLKSSIPKITEVDWGPPIIDPDRRIGVIRAFRTGYPNGLALDEKPEPVADLLIASFPWFLRRTGLAPLLLRAPLFPTPWLELDPPTRERLAQAVPIGLARPRAFQDNVNPPGGGNRFSDVIRHGRKRKKSVVENLAVSFEVEIDFSQKLEAIEGDFSRWVHKKRSALRQAAAIPLRLRNPGRGAQINYDALLWLACYNFRDADIPYAEARELTAQQKKDVHVDAPLVDLPYFDQDSNWSKNANRAKRLMARLFIPKDCPLEHAQTLMELLKGAS